MTQLSTPHIPYVSDAEEKAAIADVLKPHVIAICNQYDGMMLGSFTRMNDNSISEMNEIVECASHHSLLCRSVIESIVYDLWNLTVTGVNYGEQDNTQGRKKWSSVSQKS